jgi:ABC-type proline/glycine betaine transport system permease subunit
MVVGFLVFLLALPLTVAIRLEKWYASPPTVRFIAWSRTLAVASVVAAAVVAPTAGGGGAGPLIFEGMRALDYAQVLRGLAIVLVLALTIDLVLGASQLLLSQGRR